MLAGYRIIAAVQPGVGLPSISVNLHEKQDNMRAALAVVLIATACALPPMQGINHAYFAEHKSRRILVMQFEGNEDLVKESTEHFITLLSDQSKLEIVRPDPETAESQPTWNPLKIMGRRLKEDARSLKKEARGFPMSLLRGGHGDSRTPLLVTARELAETKSANIIILGTITSQGDNMGRSCTSRVRIYDAETGAEVANFIKRYDRMVTFTSRPLALKAVASTAAETKALLE